MILDALFSLFSDNYHENPIANRIQWEENFGYCGETCFIEAGLYYGQYCSQATARSLASPGIPPTQKKSQLLLGANDTKAAAAMKLKVLSFDTAHETSTADFFVWMKEKVDSGYPVVTGVFSNQSIFLDGSGDNTYDHIAMIYAISSSHPLSDPTYYSDNRFFMSDNGLYTGDDDKPVYFFNYGFTESQRTRKEANAIDAPPYSINSNYQVAKSGGNYAIAFLGVLDDAGDTIPVRLATDINYEPASTAVPTPITLTVTVTIPDQAKSYHLHYYTSFDDVPISHFNSSGKPAQTWLIPAHSGPTYTLTLPKVLSNQTAAFRAVSVSAP